MNLSVLFILFFLFLCACFSHFVFVHYQDSFHTCALGHKLINVGITNDGWKCNGEQFHGKCLKGCTDFEQTFGWSTFRCVECDFDLCEKCILISVEVNFLFVAGFFCFLFSMVRFNFLMNLYCVNFLLHRLHIERRNSKVASAYTF